MVHHIQKGTIPWFYRVLFLYFEPLAALGGTLMLFLRPASFLSSMSPTAIYAPDNQVVYQNLGAAYLLFSWNEAVLLRAVGEENIKAWRWVMTGILLCDALHLYAAWSAVGGDIFWNPALWRGEEWINLGTLWGQGFVRMAFLAGVGLEDGIQKEKK